MSLIKLSSTVSLHISLLYATPRNFTGAPVYRAEARAFLHADAAAALARAAELAEALGLGLLVYDAFRPTEAQAALWAHTPDPEFLAPPERGSNHSRGVAVDLTLCDAAGQPLDMGTAFDAFTPLSYHGRMDIPREAQQRRFVLLGIMSAAGFDHIPNEWWHYQLPDAKDYPLRDDRETGMMP